MILRDRKKLARLMVIQEVSQRELARSAGWKSHSYLGRLLRGEAKTLDTDPALRIAHRLMVPVDDLFQIRPWRPEKTNGGGGVNVRQAVGAPRK